MLVKVTLRPGGRGATEGAGSRGLAATEGAGSRGGLALCRRSGRVDMGSSV